MVQPRWCIRRQQQVADEQMIPRLDQNACAAHVSFTNYFRKSSHVTSYLCSHEYGRTGNVLLRPPRLEQLGSERLLQSMCSHVSFFAIDAVL